jgi:uncharacterized phage protein (TIGR01671 family)
MRELRYRQAIYTNGKFRGFHFWGFSKGGFTAPETGVSSVEDATKNSGQFTGLRDRRGVEIYEGDVIRRNKYRGKYRDQDEEECVGIIEWEESTARFVCNAMFSQFIPNKVIEVIGNIHENPDLLKERTEGE